MLGGLGSALLKTRTWNVLTSWNGLGYELMKHVRLVPTWRLKRTKC